MPTTSKVNADKLQEALLSLKDGAGCWAFIAGSGTGSMVTLDFGGKVARLRPLKNRHVSEDARNYKGEYCLFLQHCAWRIESADEVICSSSSSNHHGGPMLRGLQRLIGQRVSEATVHAPSFDLVLQFGNGLRLSIFCVVGIDDWDNYTFHTGSHIYASTYNGHLEESLRDTVS
ncbi:hypothetical protein OVA24_01340 [Luteolibacter sp. SL250]|uniref:hypothetical protein n=1 Tax=Luteolibacter sp. SL250 TaxID=2995170 RepID=UPI00226D944E|nr:hypothetical protein [Luteolibacter sp. SL250]WAC20021.1 hypothetical protein OVA24_01340 [Luteolibacter sp. SL250]